MSTNNPMASSSCVSQCPTGWGRVKCSIASVTCKVQRFFDPLCETRKDYLDGDLLTALKQAQDVFSYARSDQVISEVLNKDEGRPTYDFLKDYILALRGFIEVQPAKTHPTMLALNEYCALMEKQKPWLSEWNRIGLAMAYGTNCNCCLGWRALAAGIVGVIIGGVLF